MKKISGALVAAFVSMFGLLLVVAPSAQAAYPSTPVVIHVSATNVQSGKTISFNVASPKPCEQWTARFHGGTRYGHGATFSGSFRAPSVNHTRTFPMTFTCDTGNGAARPAGHAGNAVMVPQEVITRTVQITVHPSSQGGPAATSNGGSASAGILPNTGGPNGLLLGGGLALLVIGGASVAYGRRREHA